MTETPTAEKDAPRPVVHKPRCNTNCEPGRHYLTSGIGYPHLHRTDLAGECGECAARRHMEPCRIFGEHPRGAHAEYVRRAAEGRADG